MKNHLTYKLTINALGIAMVAIATMFLQFPIPLGYAHLGNCFILLFAIFFGPSTGLITAGIGSALADLLTGYTLWVIPTLIIKSLMGYLIGKIASQDTNKSLKSKYVFLASIVGIVEMIAGYTIAGAILEQSIPAGVAQIPGLSIEGLVGIVLFYGLYGILLNAKIKRLIHD